jgi:TolB-like protein
MFRLLTPVFALGLFLSSSAQAARPATAPATATALPAVAVMYFDYTGKDEELGQLKKGFAQMIITDLSTNSGFRVVERDRIEEIIDELKLQSSDLADPATAVKVGKLVGAKRMVFGSYFDMMGTLRVDTRLVDVETGVVTCSVGVNGRRDQFLEFESSLADKLAVAMLSDGKDCTSPLSGAPPVVPSQANKGVASLDVAVVADFSRALDAKDNDEPEKAKVLLQEVLKEEPEFKLAQDELAKLMK